MTKDEYYNRPKGCEHKALMVIAFIVILFSLVFSCESPELSDDCCYICYVKTLYKFPGSNPYDVTYFAHYKFCDKTAEWIREWEQVNTYNDTIQDIYQFTECSK
jgi:hypothetical protein